MLLLPLFNATLRPCPESPAAFRNHAQGWFYAGCQRVAHDFSRSANPEADLAAPDGRVCGSFRATQVQGPPLLSRRLRWFLVALVLEQGLLARSALAQVQRAAVGPHRASASGQAAREAAQTVYGGVSEQMPGFRGGSYRAALPYVQQRLV